MFGLLVLVLNLLLSFLAVSGNPDEPNTKQKCNKLMLSKMEAMQKKIENSDREMKQTLADMTAKFQSEIDELKIQIQSYELKPKSKNTNLENVPSSEKHDGQGELLVQSELSENKKDAIQAVKKKGIRQLPETGVAFTAYLDHVEYSLGDSQTIIYNQALFNDGQAYSANTGIFRAPLTGVYLFSWSVMERRQPGKSGYDVSFDLLHNGSPVLTAVAESRVETDDNQGSNTAVLKLAQGDEVWTVHKSGDSEMYGSTNRETSFVGVLLYETEI